MSPAPDTSLVRGDYREIFDHVPFGLHFECPFGAQVRFQHLLESASTADVHLQRLRGASELGFRIQRLDSGHFRKPNARRRKIERRGGAAKRTGRKNDQIVAYRRSSRAPRSATVRRNRRSHLRNQLRRRSAHGSQRNSIRRGRTRCGGNSERFRSFGNDSSRLRSRSDSLSNGTLSYVDFFVRYRYREAGRLRSSAQIRGSLFH